MTTQSQSYTRTQADTTAPHLPPESAILGRAGKENFKVASRLLPETTRRHLMAFYGYARLVDYLGDELAADRLSALEWLESETRSALSGPVTTSAHPLVARAADSVMQLGLDPTPLFDLIAANVADQTVKSYRSFDDLLGYCRLSANPVGRLVLGAFSASTAERVAWSDAICTGLQLAEHWQDVTEDAAAGRVYIPQEDLERFGVLSEELAGTGRPSRQWRALMMFEVARARRFLDAGAPLIGDLDGSARWAVCGFWAGGHAALDAIAARGFDVTGAPAKPAPARVAAHMTTGLVRRRR